MAQQRNDKADNRPNDKQPEHFVKEVPKGGREVVYKDVHYHYAEGRYYRPRDGYEMVQPTVGMEIDDCRPATQ
jgi:hypothetical protein